MKTSVLSIDTLLLGLSLNLKPSCPQCFQSLGNLHVLKKKQQTECNECGTLVDVNQLIQHFERSYHLLEGMYF